MSRGEWGLCEGNRRSCGVRGAGIRTQVARVVEYWRREYYIRASSVNILCIMKGHGIGGRSFLVS